ncbi:uncharacterized protein LOC115999347 [Ipomoea triloba]|uniref:uncharacterized protein LOC115999347 n=1 Tax=Ipomoea triloba TaxID=35885 RepID=UPI00125E3877|nr:uncharacterized protein LOC115999347 [Ipomoea triloba]
MDLIRDLFNPTDVQNILSVPTSMSGGFDTPYWMGESHGFYTVKSGYRIAAGCRDRGGVRVWAGVWDFDILPKVPCNPLCVFCGVEPETMVHLFANCPFAKACWREVDLGWRLGDVASIEEWVEEMWDELPRTMIEMVVVVCWALWEARNNRVWNMHAVDSKSLVMHANIYVNNWRVARQQNIVSR